LTDFSNLPPEGGVKVDRPGLPVGQAHVEDDGVVFYFKVNYKVVLLVFIALDLLHISLDELVARFLGIRPVILAANSLLDLFR
jgi:hypothetical protein